MVLEKVVAGIGPSDGGCPSHGWFEGAAGRLWRLYLELNGVAVSVKVLQKSVPERA